MLDFWTSLRFLQLTGLFGLCQLFFPPFLAFFWKIFACLSKSYKTFFFASIVSHKIDSFIALDCRTRPTLANNHFFGGSKSFGQKTLWLIDIWSIKKAILTYWLLAKRQYQRLCQQNIAFAKCLMTNSLFAKYLLDKSVFPENHVYWPNVYWLNVCGFQLSVGQISVAKCLFAKCLFA